ncbi:MAG: polyprenyl synthetase family protein [Lachnospiraceae bacterium]|nr:polyprenyl synthetase family protein [Lachnospiraceae bacterium]
MDFKESLREKTSRINREISEYLPPETGFQKTILAACNYSVINGGKRLRPLLMQYAYILCRNNGSEELGPEEKTAVVPFMAAMEMIHSSSLVHDDLPCMDNDVLRRGVPSTWAKFGEDMGTLAGDGLMLYAFETACKSTAEPGKAMKCLGVLARKSGLFGMVGGQTVDVELTGKRPDKEQLEFIYKYKTGALIEASLMIGAILAGADEAVTKKLEEAAACVGMAFQIQDDILDVTATESELGKPIGSDSCKGKVTWLTYYGMEQSERDVSAYTEKALDIIRQIGSCRFLEELLISLIGRRS